MGYNVVSPANSFIQFNETGNVTSCEFADINLCLPVYEDDDINFQFVVEADTTEEANDLCGLENLVDIGITRDCSIFDINFSQDPDRYRISDKQVLYNWPNGLPGFTSVIDTGECFTIMVKVGGQNFCSNCLQRISDPCHTSVIEYGNDDNFAGFNYCNSVGVDQADTAACDPTFVSFTNQSTLNIPYTAAMLAKYGNAPTLKVWIYDTSGELVNMSVRQAFDTYPPNNLLFDFGGPATGIIKIN